MDVLNREIMRGLLDVHGYITASDLAEMTGISGSSIRHHIREVRKELKRYDVDLISVPKKGFYLEATKAQRLEIIKKLSAGDSPTFFSYRKRYILEVLFEYNSNYTIQLFADELYTSRYTIQKDLINIEKMLKRYHLALSKVRNYGVCIAGSEHNIRQAMLEYYMANTDESEVEEPLGWLDCRISRKDYIYLQRTYSGVRIRAVQEALKQSERSLEMVFTDVSFLQLLEYIALSLKRIRKGNMIQNADIPAKVRAQSKFILAAERVWGTLLSDGPPSEAEIQFLAVRMQVLRTFKGISKRIRKSYQTAAQEFLERLGAIIHQERLGNDKVLLREIGDFFEQVRLRNQYEMIIWNDIHKEVKDRCSSIYGICLTALFTVEEALDINFTQDDVAWIAMLIHNETVDSARREALLITASSAQTSKYIARKLTHEIEMLSIIQTLHYDAFAPELVPEGCLVITTVQLPSNGAIQISKQVDENDLERIQAQIVKKEPEIQDASILSKIFYEDLIICDLIAKDREEAIAKACERLLEKGYVREGFLDKIWERENITPTSIGSEIAIPHVYKAFVNESAAAVVRLKYPVKWSDNEPIKIIILLAINFDTKKEIRELLQALYAFIDNHNKCYALKIAENEREMFRALM